MQTIPSTMETILKSKQLFGNSAPRALITFTPDIDDDSVTFTGTSAHTLQHQSLSTGTVVVTNTSAGTTYTETADYSIDYTNGTITRATSGAIGSTQTVLADYTFSVSVKPTFVRVQYERAAFAGYCEAAWPNVSSSDPTDMGYYSPDRGDDIPADKNNWYHAVLPGCDLKVDLGYTNSTSNMVQTFKGQVDEVALDVKPEGSMIRIEARDDSWKLLDNVVGSSTNSYQVTYSSTRIDQIAYDLLVDAGFSSSGVTVQKTPQSLVGDKTFSKENYASALEWCIENSGYELIVDRYGNADFHYPTDRQPQVTNESVTFTGTSAHSLNESPIVSNSEVVSTTNSTGSTGYIVYTSTTDYSMNYANGTITRATGGTIPSTGTVHVDYVYPAWIFRQGEDLFNLDYRITRRNVYGTIWVSGASSAGSTGIYNYAGSTFFGIGNDKVIFFDLTNLDTSSSQGSTAALQDAANQLGNDMIRKNRAVRFEAVAVPWIDPGDSVQVVESRTTISEIYRILSLEYEFSTGGAIMRGTAYHYGYAPLS